MKITDYYCNQKFWFLSINLEKFKIYSCCAASPQKIDIAWLKQNPGQIFNTPELHSERGDMLSGRPAPSCEASCWQPERQCAPSKRTIMFGQKRTHVDVQADPEILHLILGSDCNLTCVYCCKFYSSAWARDVGNNTYPVEIGDDRYKINDLDRVLDAISQKESLRSASRQVLLDEIAKIHQSPKLREVIISGGEPFLYLELADIVSKVPSNIPIEIYTGLGVDERRFAKEIGKLPNNVTIVISAESVGPLYEFVRYGNTWERFNNNIEQLKAAGLKYRFNATVSNLTVSGLKDFIDYADAPIRFDACLDPDYLSISVLDSETKNLIRQHIESMPDFVADALNVEPTEKQVNNFKSYIKEFANRRALSLDVFPQPLVDWIMTQGDNNVV